MTQKSQPTLGAPNSSEPKKKTAPTASKGMTHEKHMKLVSQRPQFTVRQTSGKGFVIGGVKRP